MRVGSVKGVLVGRKVGDKRKASESTLLPLATLPLDNKYNQMTEFDEKVSKGSREPNISALQLATPPFHLPAQK